MSLSCFQVCSLLLCGHLKEKGLFVIFIVILLLFHWYPEAGVVLECIDFFVSGRTEILLIFPFPCHVAGLERWKVLLHERKSVQGDKQVPFKGNAS